MNEGQLLPTAESRERINTIIREKIALDRDAFSYPEMFVDAASYPLDDAPDGQVLWLPPGSRIDGPLELDWEKDWIREHDVAMVAVEGDLTVDGPIVNLQLESGPGLFVAGHLTCGHMKKGGSSVVVLGDLNADGHWVIGDYNDGIMGVGGNLRADVFMLLDHEGFVLGETKARCLSFEETSDWDAVLVPEAIEDEIPNGDQIWELLAAGRAVLRD